MTNRKGPHVYDPGGQIPGQAGLTRRHLAAGDVQAQRRVRVSPSSDQMDGGGHLRLPGSKPHQGVVVVELKVTGNDAGDELCGCRSSGEDELASEVVLEARGQLLCGLRGAVRLVEKVV